MVGWGVPGACRAAVPACHWRPSCLLPMGGWTASRSTGGHECPKLLMMVLRTAHGTKGPAQVNERSKVSL